MTFVHKAFTAKSVCCLALSAAFLTGCANLEDNMAASKKANLVPGKEIHVTKQGDNFVFCEVALITGTTKSNAIADFYNSTGTDICTPRRSPPSTARRSRRRRVRGRSSSTRRGAGCSTSSMSIRTESSATFGGIKMTWMGVVPVEELEKGVTKGHYVPGYISRDNQYTFNKGTEIYLLDAPDGEVFVMQSFTNYVQKEVDIDHAQGPGPLAPLAAGLEVPLRGPRSRPARQPEADQRPRPRLPGRPEERLPGLRRRQGVQLRSVRSRVGWRLARAQQEPCRTLDGARARRQASDSCVDARGESHGNEQEHQVGGSSSSPPSSSSLPSSCIPSWS